VSDVAIRTEGLTKRFGKHVALDALDLDIERGQVFGFLGPNGAGKTTTIRLLLDLLRPTQGRAEIHGMDCRGGATELHRRIGHLPGEFALWPTLTGRETLDHLAALRGLDSTTRRDELVERFGVELDRPVRHLSRGNRQKIGLVQAFMHSPDVVLLDEPTSGLDPLVQHEFHTLVEESVAKGCTVFLSSHVLSEVQHTASRVGVIRAGRLVTVSTVDELMARAPHRFELRLAEAADPARFASLPGTSAVTVDGRIVRGIVTGSADALVKAAAHEHVETFTSREPELEEVFLSLYDDAPTAHHDAA
jgi:ABC-2 type transport system ATP-binding protein